MHLGITFINVVEKPDADQTERDIEKNPGGLSNVINVSRVIITDVIVNVVNKEGQVASARERDK